MLKQLPSLEAERNKQQTELSKGDVKRETRLNGAATPADGAIVTEELRKVLLALSPQVRTVTVSDSRRFAISDFPRLMPITLTASPRKSESG